MLIVGWKSVRHYPALFVGSFLTMALGVGLLGVAALSLASVLSVRVPPTGPRVSLDGGGGTQVFFRDAIDLRGITTVLVLAAVVSAATMITNVTGTFAFAVALRRRDIGLLRLLGAGAWQVRRTVLAEASAVALPAAAVGCLIAALAAAPVLRALSRTDLAPVPLPDHASDWALVFAGAAGVLLALLAALLASRRAARVRPAEALRDAAVDAGVMTTGRWVAGGLASAAGAVMMATAPAAGPLNSTPLVIFGVFALTIAAAALGPVYLPGLVRLVGAQVLRLTGVGGRLAAASVATSRRHSASLAVPVLSIVAVAGIMMGVLQTTDATDLADQVARSKAQLVVEPVGDAGLDRDTLARVAAAPGVRTVSAPAGLRVAFATPDSGSRQPGAHGGAGVVTAGALDLPALAAVRTLRVVEGRIAPLVGTQIAVRQEFVSWYSVHAGSTLRLGLFDGRTVDATVAVILDGGSDLPQIMLSPALAGAQAADPAHADVLLDTAGEDPGAAAARLAAAVGPGRVRVRPVSQWYAARAAAQDRLGNLVLFVLIGPASLFALVAIAGTVVMAISRRGREVAVMTLLGASRGLIRRMVVLEGLLVTCLAVGVAAAFVTTGLTGYRTALRGTFLATGGGVPGPVLAGLALACIMVATVTGLLAVARPLRRPAVTMVASG